MNTAHALIFLLSCVEVVVTTFILTTKEHLTEKELNAYYDLTSFLIFGGMALIFSILYQLIHCSRTCISYFWMNLADVLFFLTFACVNSLCFKLLHTLFITVWYHWHALPSLLQVFQSVSLSHFIQTLALNNIIYLVFW